MSMEGGLSVLQISKSLSLPKTTLENGMRISKAGHKDLFTGKVIGYAMAERMTKNLFIQSLRALHTYPLISTFHSQIYG
jgi:hypothetical protein